MIHRAGLQGGTVRNSSLNSNLNSRTSITSYRNCTTKCTVTRKLLVHTRRSVGSLVKSLDRRIKREVRVVRRVGEDSKRCCNTVKNVACKRKQNAVQIKKPVPQWSANNVCHLFNEKRWKAADHQLRPGYWANQRVIASGPKPAVEFVLSNVISHYVISYEFIYVRFICEITWNQVQNHT